VEAVMHDADGSFVWVVAEDNTASPRPVKMGAYIGSRQIVESGLLSGDRVMVAGMQKVRPGMAVQPQDIQVAD
jgi:multidrug efflux pump subunit AcrA (membrane-fusion protein)